MIRKAKESDLPRIAEIHAEAWHAAYRDIISNEILARVTPQSRLESWSNWFKDGQHELYVSDQNRETVGFACLSDARPIANPPAGYGELTHLYLDPTALSTGLGHELFVFAEECFRSRHYSGMLLWTLEDNANARRFYERHGMHTDGVTQDEPAWLGEGVYEIRYLLPFAA